MPPALRIGKLRDAAVGSSFCKTIEPATQTSLDVAKRDEIASDRRRENPVSSVGCERLGSGCDGRDKRCGLQRGWGKILRPLRGRQNSQCQRPQQRMITGSFMVLASLLDPGIYRILSRPRPAWVFCHAGLYRS